MPSPKKLRQGHVGAGALTCPVEHSSAQVSDFLTLVIIAAALTAILVTLPSTLSAQSSGASPTRSGEPAGVTNGGYLIHSSVELGYRGIDVTGSGDMYGTLVDLQQGPRILDQSLSMHSIDHQGIVFDNLSINSFGWGGDPNNALRIRADKNKWYNFTTSFRRDYSHSDFDLLANPLNPPTSAPDVPILRSPHLFDTVRRMTDVDMTLLPQSRMSFRLGYSHNNMTGPSFSSIHEGTEGLLVDDWATIMNSYRLGVDWRFLPRTVLSYDQFLNYFQGDNSYGLAPAESALLPSAAPGGETSVNLGLSFDTVNSTPCAVKAPATSLINSSGVLTNLACSGYYNYLRNQRIRTGTPTERIGLRSNYSPRLDFVGSYAYSAAKMNTPFYESFSGLLSRTNTLDFTGTGAAYATRISNVADLEATLHLTPHLRLIQKYYFWAYRIPEYGNFNELDYSCAHTPCTLLSAPLTTPEVAGGTPTLADSSFNQTWQREQTDLAWDFSNKAGARIGFRYGDRTFNLFNSFGGAETFEAFTATGEDHFSVDEYTGLLGLWARPIHSLRLNFDFEHTNYDNAIVRMAPRKESRYRFQTTYTPRPWAVVGGSINIVQDANNAAYTSYVGHNQNYGLTASLAPREHIGADLAYNFNSVMQNAFICFNDTPPAGVTLPFVTGATTGTGTFCTTNESANPLFNNAYYTNHTNFGMATIRFRPDKRVTTNFGYSIASVDGSEPQFNILQPLGSLQYRYQQPVANVVVDIGHNLAWNMGWNYYQYAEGSRSFVGPTAPRYFHANAVTESLRYAF